MRYWLMRWMAYLLIPAGLVLLVVPLNTTLTEIVEQETVFLSITETLTPPEPIAEEPPAPAGTEEAVFQELQQAQAKLSSQFSFEATATNAAGIPVVQKQGFSAAPLLHEAVEDQITRLRLWSQDKLEAVPLETVTVEEWSAFQAAHTEEGAFQYGNRLFSGFTAPYSMEVEVEVKNLTTGCKIAGGLFLLLSAFALHGIYVPATNGIRVGKRSAIVLWDLIIIGIGTVFMWMALDAILHWSFGTEWWGGDEMMAGMSFFWIALVTPFMAFYTTATAIQALWITMDGIALKGLMGLRAIPWSNVASIELSGIRGPQSTTGGIPTRTVTRHLIVSGESGSLRVLEPPYASTKKEILAALQQFAPPELTEHIATIEKEWLSLW